MRTFISLVLLILLFGCNSQVEKSIQTQDAPFLWENANIYFLLTDRFNNGNPDNDLNFDRTLETAVNRGFQGGDIAGVTQKIEEAYFSDLGITAIWMTPFVEQIHGIVDEGTGPTYGFHGYWAKDWTSLDPNFGTEEELAALIETAHSKGIRVIMDVVINHTGPVTEVDPAWNVEWVRTEPTCQHKDYESTVTCTLVENLPDIRTDSNEEVELPDELTKKWKNEGRLEQEMEELDQFFERTGYPRTPTYYIIKWLTDYVRKYGIDGYRLDTAKHVEEDVWSKLRKEADAAFKEWKAANPDKVLSDIEFYMVGEVYNYGASSPFYDFGDTLVNFYEHGINGLINFEFKSDVRKTYEEIFVKYSDILNGDLKDQTTVNYISSHDDSWSYDKMRKDPVISATKLLLSPGAVQVYYGDETARILHAEGAMGDAHLRSFMNWEELESNTEINGFPVKDILQHWQKLGKFRALHPSIGAGVHTMLSESPYIFKREYANGDYKDKVLVGLDLERGKKVINVHGEFKDGATITDAYSGQQGIVSMGKVEIDSEYNIVLLFS
ncbi:alpha-amylase family glycosyl hydrolase [Bacteroidota bacterium]